MSDNLSFVEPPFNYTGSKDRLLSQLIPLFDKQKTRFVDLFSGGGSVWTNVIQDYGGIVVNDIIADLIEVQRKLILETAVTISITKGHAVAKDDPEAYGNLRASYNASPTPEKLWALMMCCTNNMMRFNQSLKFNQTFGKRTFNAKTEEKAKVWARHLRKHLDKITFSSVDFAKTEINPQTFCYIDPPYSNTEAGYNAYWAKDDDLRLADFCNAVHSLGATFCVSGTLIHDGESCRLIDHLIEDGFQRIDLNHNYNKVSRRGNKDTQEVVIVNYTPVISPPPKEDVLFPV